MLVTRGCRECANHDGEPKITKNKYKYLQKGAQKVFVFHRDPREQGTPPDPPNAHAAMQQLSVGHTCDGEHAKCKTA